MRAENKMILLAGLAGAGLALGILLAADASEVERVGAAAQTGVQLRFQQAPLAQVLRYLGEAAGFTIVLEAQPKGLVNVWSEQSLDREEALNLVNSLLVQNGLAAIRSGQTLTVVNRDEAKVHDIPVKLGSDPAAIPRIDEVVTQILPVRFIEVAQLVKDLQPLVSTRTTMTANESANTLVITDTQANIHHVAEIVRAIDAGAESYTAVKIIHLTNADATEMANLLAELFPDQSQSEDSQVPAQLGAGMPGPPGIGGFPGGPDGPGGFGGGGPAGPGGDSGQSAGSGRVKKAAKVTAVADPRTSSVIVSAPKELISQIEGVVAQLDASPAHRKAVAVFQLNSAQPQDVAKVLQTLFQNTGTSAADTSSSQTSAFETRRTTQSQQQLSTASSFGSSGTSRGGLGGGGGGAGGGGAPSQ
jgi:general secretion pathway protein D